MLAGIVAGIAGIWIVPSPSYTAAIEACQGIATKADLQVATLVAWSLLGAFLALIPALAMTLASWGKRTCSRRTIGLVVGGLVVGALAVLILLLSSSPAASAGQDPLRACLGALRRPVDFSPGPVAYAALDMALIGLAIGLADYLYEHGRARPA